MPRRRGLLLRCLIPVRKGTAAAACCLLPFVLEQRFQPGGGKKGRRDSHDRAFPMPHRLRAGHIWRCPCQERSWVSSRCCKETLSQPVACPQHVRPPIPLSPASLLPYSPPPGCLRGLCKGTGGVFLGRVLEERLGKGWVPCPAQDLLHKPRVLSPAAGGMNDLSAPAEDQEHLGSAVNIFPFWGKGKE